MRGLARIHEDRNDRCGRILIVSTGFIPPQLPITKKKIENDFLVVDWDSVLLVVVLSVNESLNISAAHHLEN